jgi:hypothetical protein
VEISYFLFEKVFMICQFFSQTYALSNVKNFVPSVFFWYETEFWFSS